MFFLFGRRRWWWICLVGVVGVERNLESRSDVVETGSKTFLEEG